MAALRVLFIGGTGVISAACVSASVVAGFEVTALTRDETSLRPLPPGVRPLVADVRDPPSLAEALHRRTFDVVADFLSFVPDDVRFHRDHWRERIRQYVFVSSASAYQTPPARLPIVESTPLRNPWWQYSRDKIACEDVLVHAYREDGFPATIVRPSHTYDRTSVPLVGRATALERIRRGRPVVVHGDGTSLWTLTHAADFARAFVGLLGEPRAAGESFHITSDEALTWDQITTVLAEAAGMRPRIVHVPAERIAALDPDWGAGLLGDKAHSMVFDNSKIKAWVPGWQAVVPFWRGAAEIVEWHDADTGRRAVDPDLDQKMDLLIGETLPRS